MTKEIAVAFYFAQTIMIVIGFLAAFEVISFNVLGALFAFILCNQMSSLFMSKHLVDEADKNNNG
jgi:hypothetical protein